MSTQAGAPRLLRAIAETTQPYGPLLEGKALHTLEEYLSDVSQVDTVYLTVLNRASGEPLSLAVVDKCIALLKRYLPRYKASQQVLERAEDFCAQASSTVTTMSPSMQKSLVYLQALVTRLMGSKRHQRFSKTSPASQHQKSSSDTPVPLPVSALARAFSSPAPLLVHQKSRSSTHSVSHRLSEPLSTTEDPPSNWAIHHDMLTARFGSGQPDAAVSASIAPFLPSLQHPPAAAETDPKEDRWPGEAGGSTSQEHVRTIAALQRVQASQANYSSHPALDISRPKLRDNRPRLLFQYLPYIQQDALRLDAQDVEAVLEATCGGGGAAGGQSSIWGVEDTEELWKRDSGRQGWGGAGGSQGDSAGQVCAAVLVKLVMDMYLKATPAVAFPLTLIMLHRALNSTVSSVRARPFDVLYNLSLHAELLFSPSRDSNQDCCVHQADLFRGKRASIGRLQHVEHRHFGPEALPESLDPDSVLEGAWAESAQSGMWGTPEGLDPSLEAFRTWLRHLLWELTLLLVQREEKSPQVWSAVLGCLLHLVTHCGYVVRGYLQGLPLRVLAALMQCCLHHHWCHATYCHLVRLAVNLMYVPASPNLDSEGRGESGQEGAAGLQLSQEAVEEFGGVTQLVAHFKAAPTPEARRNILAILLDQAAHCLTQEDTSITSSTDANEATLYTNTSSSMQADLAEVVSMLSSNSVPDALQTAFQVADPDFAGPIAHALQEAQQAAGSSLGGGSSQSVLSSLLYQLELMACTEASTAVPPSLQPVVQHTLDCISSAYQQPPDPTPDSNQAPTPPGTTSRHRPAGSSSSVPVSPEEEPIALDEAWLCLAELLCEEDSWAASVGESWLYRLLVQAAEQHMQHCEQQPGAHNYQQGEQYFDAEEYDYPPSPERVDHRRTGLVGLLPHPLGGPPKPDAPAHLSNQPQLSQLLMTVLAYSSDSTTTGLSFIGVIRRLVMHIKLKCSLGQIVQHEGKAADSNRDHNASNKQRADYKREPRSSCRRDSGFAEDLLESTGDPGMGNLHSALPEQASSALPSKASASNEGLADTQPLLMRTSPALDWGKPPPPSRQASGVRALESDDGGEQGGGSEVNQLRVSHHRTQSDPRGMFHTALSTAGSIAASGGESVDAPGQGIAAGPSGPASNVLSSAMSTAELTGFFQEPDKQEGAIVTHEGIVLHDAPLLGRNSPEHVAEPADVHEGGGSLASGQATSSPEGNGGSPWQADRAAGMVLSTLYLATEWILQAHPANRQDALQEIAALLLTFLCTPAPSAPATSASPPMTPRLPPPSQVTIDILANDPAHVTIRMPSPHGTASPTPATTPCSASDQHGDSQAQLAAASSLAWCFLTGLVSVPEEVLQQVAPVLLVRLLHHLNSDSTATAGSTTPPAGGVSQPLPQGPACQTAQDTRAALVLLLIARCNMEQTALQQAGGEALFATLLKDADARVRYHASMFVQQRLVATKADQYRRALRQLTQQAQQVNDEKLLRNPYLQISAMLDMRLVDLSV